MQNITALSVEQVETALKIAGRGVLTVGSSIWSRNLWIALVQTALFTAFSILMWILAFLIITRGRIFKSRKASIALCCGLYVTAAVWWGNELWRMFANINNSRVIRGATWSCLMSLRWGAENACTSLSEKLNEPSVELAGWILYKQVEMGVRIAELVLCSIAVFLIVQTVCSGGTAVYRLTFGLIALSFVLLFASVERASHDWLMVSQLMYTKYGYSALLLHWVANTCMAAELVQAARNHARNANIAGAPSALSLSYKLYAICGVLYSAILAIPIISRILFWNRAILVSSYSAESLFWNTAYMIDNAGLVHLQGIYATTLLVLVCIFQSDGANDTSTLRSEVLPLSVDEKSGVLVDV